MHARLLLLALGWRSNDLYEQVAGKAVRSYLIWLFFPIMLTCAVFFSLGLALTQDLHIAFVISFVLGCVVGLMVPFASLSSLSIPAHMSNSLVENEEQTALVRSISAQHGIAKVIDVYDADMKEEQACYISSRFAHMVLLDHVLVRRCNERIIAGVVCHEVGHALLPLGTNFFFCAVLFQESFVDVLLYYARSKLMFLQLDLVLARLGVKKKILVYVRSFFWMSLEKVCYYSSSLPGNRRREYACDAISALLLHDAVPLIIALRKISAYRKQSVMHFKTTHPSPEERIAALLAIHMKSVNAH